METRFSRFNPLVSFLFYAGSISIIILMLHPILLVMGLFLMLILNILHDRMQGLKRWKFFIISTFFLMILLNPLFNERGRHLLFEIGQHRVTLEAVTYGGMNAMSIICIIGMFVSYNVIMTPNKLLFLFGKILPQFAVLLMLTLRFIPLMKRRMEEIALVQKSKGLSINKGKWTSRIRMGMLFVQTLLTYSLEEAIQTADSMKARGYGNGLRSSYEYFRFRKGDAAAIIYLSVLFVLIMMGRINGYGMLSVYPVMEPWSPALMDVGVLVCYSMFISFPIIVEAGEWIRWRLSN